MTNIEWKNIFYMIGYCIDEIQYFEDDNIGYEYIEGINEVLAILLCKSFEDIVANGYCKEYRNQKITTDKPRGRIDIVKSVRTGAIAHGNLVCNIRVLNSDALLNRIIKTAFVALNDANDFGQDKLSKDTALRVQECLNRLYYVKEIRLSIEDLGKLNDIPCWYEKAINISKIILKDYMVIDKNGETKLLNLKKEDRCKYIFEKFVLNYFKKEHREYTTKKQSFKWVQDCRLEPDVLINNKKTNRSLIIDTKFYDKTSHGSRHNVSQINSYAQNFRKYTDDRGERKESITGILLYAGKGETRNSKKDEYYDGYMLSTWEICLNQEFALIKNDLDMIANRYLMQEDSNDL